MQIFQHRSDENAINDIKHYFDENIYHYELSVGVIRFVVMKRDLSSNDWSHYFDKIYMEKSYAAEWFVLI